MADATAANLKAFDQAWSNRTQLAGRFKYNLEGARKEFLAMLDAVSVSRSGQQVLDVGFGSGMLMFEFAPDSLIRGVEISQSALASARSRAKKLGFRDAQFVKPESPTAIPFGDASFTVVIASHVVEHIEDDIAFMRELLRVVRPGGWLIIVGPIDNFTSGILDEAAVINPAFAEGHYHVRNYNPETFLSRVERAGGRVERSALSMATWDWKVRGDEWRSALNRTFPGKVLDRGIAAALNLPLTLMPHAWLRRVDRQFERLGYRPRQITVAVRRA